WYHGALSFRRAQPQVELRHRRSLHPAGSLRRGRRGFAPLNPSGGPGSVPGVRGNPARSLRSRPHPALAATLDCRVCRLDLDPHQPDVGLTGGACYRGDSLDVQTGAPAPHLIMKNYRLALLPGDGIGKEVIPAAVKVLNAAVQGFTLSFEPFDWGCEYYLRQGRMMPEEGLETLRPFDAILLGAIGHPTVPDHISLRDLLLRIRFEFDLYVNLRPVEILPGLGPPLRGKRPEDINMLFVRENTEGEYAGLGGRFKRGTQDEVAIQQSVFTRRGVERVVRYAFQRAQRRPRKRLASATKSNAMQYTMVLWDEVVRAVASEYPDVSVASYHVDALAARMITHPESLDVVVGSN